MVLAGDETSRKRNCELGLTKFSIKFRGLIPESTQDTTAVAFPMKPMQYPYLRRLILMMPCSRNKDYKKLDHSIVVAAISQWRRRLSACVRAHGGHFENILCRFHGLVC